MSMRLVVFQDEVDFGSLGVDFVNIYSMYHMSFEADLFARY